MYLTILTALLAALCSTTHAEPIPQPKPTTCPCYTATSYISDPSCPIFTPTRPCIVPLCLMLTTTTLPGPNTACPTTPTSTSHLPCETACPRGCGTYTSTLTYSSSCLPTTTPPAPTITAHSRPCFSHTTTISGKCPEDGTVCPPPDCIYLSTTTVPAGPVLACPTTPTVTVTRTRTCLGRCDGACGTQWSTETATGW